MSSDIPEGQHASSGSFDRSSEAIRVSLSADSWRRLGNSAENPLISGVVDSRHFDAWFGLRLVGDSAAAPANPMRMTAFRWPKRCCGDWTSASLSVAFVQVGEMGLLSLAAPEQNMTRGVP